MNCYVYDTYVKAKDGHEMHFDVITGKKDHAKAIAYGKEWLKSIGQKNAVMTSKECEYCHSQDASLTAAKAIREKGYYIFEMEGCPK